MIAGLRQAAVLGPSLLVSLAVAVGQAQSPDPFFSAPSPPLAWLSGNGANDRPWPSGPWESSPAAAPSNVRSTEDGVAESRRLPASPANAIASLFAKTDSPGISSQTQPASSGKRPAAAEGKAGSTTAAGERPQGNRADPSSAARQTRPAEDRWTSGPLAYQEPTAPEPLDLGGIAARLVLGTGLALGAVVASLWAARRWLPGTAVSKKGQGRLRVIDSLSLSHRCCVQLVDIDGRQVLIGCDAGGIRSVTPLLPSFADGWAPEVDPAAADLSRG